MFGNGRARSGIIVLPCGAGKSLTGITAAQTIKKSTVVMCINNASVYQWRDEFLRWTNVARDRVKVFTSEKKDDRLDDSNDACILISTYSMVSHGGPRSREGQIMIDRMRQREWGLMILDEVHVASADHFQRVVDLVDAHCKLGLSATLVREDNRIQDLAFIVGPKLYEANWIDLTNQGYLAKVQCTEVWCPMTKEFYEKYIKYGAENTGAGPSARDSRLQRLLYTLNPTKFRVCEYLVKYHSSRGDKIILFSDDVPALIMYCEALKPVCDVPYIHGGTPSADRNVLLAMFRSRAEVKCLGLSKVGDTALDIPDANVIIQVSSHFGARRQEAQRLGRILRPKPNPTGDFNAFFYTLVSTDTKEMYFSNKRQQYLIDQGYTFKVDQRISSRANAESQILNTLKRELDLLAEVTAWKNFGLDDADDRADDDEEERGNGVMVRHHHRSMDNITGAGSAYYTET
jgi:DNA excision repair protein ERCC-3